MPEDITELKPLIRERMACVAERQAHAVLLHSWDRVAVLCAAPDHIEELGVYSEIKTEFWDALDTQPLESDFVEAIAAISDYLAHTATPFSLFKPHAQLAAEQLALSQREDAARATRIRGHYAEAAEWYTNILDDHFNCGDYEHDMMLNTHDGAQLWGDLVLEDDARAPLDVEAVMGDSEMEGVVWALRDYPRGVMRFLGEAVQRYEKQTGREKQSGGGRKGKKRDRNELPPPAWPEINAHWREKHPEESVWVRLRGGRKEYKAGVWEAGVDVSERMLAVLVDQKLGKWDRNKERLDALIKEGRLFCACGDPTMATPEKGLNWAALGKHVFIHLSMNAHLTLTPPQTTGEDAVVWIDDQNLESCIKYLPGKGVDLSQATKRFEADPDSRARVSTLFAQCPEKSRPVCGLCDALTPEDEKDSTLFLPECVDAVVHHMQTKHGKCLQERYIVFMEESVLKDT
ncbi:hypothetical protein V8D89_006332 [Ganoderma adspersum]